MKDISSAITIAAHPDKIWNVLTDFSLYAVWNPFIRAASGSPVSGTSLKIRVCPPGGKPMSFRPTVLAARRGHELRWRGRLILPGLFDGEHYFTLKPVGSGTLFTQGERFSGLLVGLVGSTTFEKVEQGMKAMNKALRQRAETDTG